MSTVAVLGLTVSTTLNTAAICAERPTIPSKTFLAESASSSTTVRFLSILRSTALATVRLKSSIRSNGLVR